MDINLWEEDGSNVKLEYRLQYSHVIVLTKDIERVIKIIRNLDPSDNNFLLDYPLRSSIERIVASITFGKLSSYWLKKPLMLATKVKSDWLPEENGVVLLNDFSKWHFIIAVFRQTTAIFAPHFLFFNNRKWRRLSKKLRTLLGYVNNSVDFIHYGMFINGKHICNAVLESSGIRQLKVEPMNFCLDGKLIYKTEKEKDLLTEEMKDFIYEDVMIDIDPKRQVRFKKPLTQSHYCNPTMVRHVVFSARWETVPNYKNLIK